MRGYGGSHAEIVPSLQPSREQKHLSSYHMELNLVNNNVNLEEDPKLQKGSLADTWISTLRDPEQRNQFGSE